MDKKLFMDEELDRELSIKEKAHKSNLMLFRIFEFLEKFGLRSFWFFYNTFDEITGFKFVLIVLLSAFRILVRLFLLIPIFYLIALFVTFDISHVLITYGVTYLIVYIVSLILRKKYENKLFELEGIYERDLETYFAKQFLKNRIIHKDTHDLIEFENGMVVSNEGDIIANAPKQTIDFKIYNLNYLDMQNINISSNDQDMSKNIASLEFNKNFSIFVDKTAERECMKYFSPSLQLQMVKSSVLSECCQIAISNKQLSAKYTKSVERPEPMDLFVFTPIQSYYVDVDSYCEDLVSYAKKIHADISTIDF